MLWVCLSVLHHKPKSECDTNSPLPAYVFLKDFLVIGDLNAYIAEDPITALKNAGFTNLVESSGGPNAYSYVWDGQAGALDHALASATLVPQVAETVEWHINADEPAFHDYNVTQTRDPAFFDPDVPYRASDHDPVIVGLDLAP